MTNHWIDFKNADVILAIGGNNAENHPISMKWVQEAKSKGAKYIVVDPRFSRSAAVADVYGPLRSGTDLAFYGGLYNYIFENGLYNEEYVKTFTNASYILKPTYSFDDGLFSGYDEEKGTYDKKQWAYEIAEEIPWDTSATGAFAWVMKPNTPVFTPLVNKKAKKDATLQDPQCVFQQMKTHYSRYNTSLVSSITGMPEDRLKEIYALYASTGASDKAGTILYAMGQTQHTYGSQNCRAMSVLQLLLGNMGIAGGGVNALRGESNVQGSTDMGLLFGNLTGYLNIPNATTHQTLASYIEKETQFAGFWSNRPKFFISMLKEWYGDYATFENDYAYDMLPKFSGKNHSHIAMFEEMDKGTIEGLFLWGQNPAVGGPNCSQERKAMEKLKWMVAVDLWETETAIFWSDKANVDPATIDTEVFLLPAACHYEKQGEVANSGRWIQWRWKAIDPPGEAKDDLEIVTEIVLKLQELYEAEGGANPEQITKLNWDYLDENGHADVTKVALAINGYTVKDGKGLASFVGLQADGSTASGCWIYTGYFTGIDADKQPSMDPAKMKTGSRNNEDKPLDEGMPAVGGYLGWSWAWPANRRIIYNRCSCDAQGNPWNEEKALVKWNGEKWLRSDVPDFGANTLNPDGTVKAWTAPDKTLSFMMTNETVSRLWAPVMNEGPFPEHYEPFESPVDNMMSSQNVNPAITIVESAAKTRGTADKFPIVMTTFRLTEHWQTGQLTRNLPWLVETMPKMFVELSPALADEKGIVSGDNVVIQNNRGAITAYAMVTDRLRPFDIGGKTVHQIAAPWHWGYGGTCAVGGIANDLTPNVGDANTSIPEYKAFLVDIRKQEV
jgi:formate dehydrogenase major subunit